MNTEIRALLETKVLEGIKVKIQIKEIKVLKANKVQMA